MLNGKKIVGILCEVGPDGHSIVVGIGINLAQPQEYFDAAGLPHGTSLALQGVPVDMDTDPEWLAQYMTDFGFDRALYTYEAEGFAPYRERYKALCVNLGRRVTYDGAPEPLLTWTTRAVSSSATRPATPASLPARSA